MDSSFIFVHGWGMDSSIWNEIAGYFPKERSYFVELGFIGKKNIPSDTKAIYITHSLGTLWTLKHHSSDIEALIAINGFSNFQNFVDERTLQIMQRGLQKNHIAQMKSFWNNCGLSKNTQNTLDQNLNTDRLHEGLEWLIHWDASTELNTLSIPVLSLGGKQDRILPRRQIEKEWAAFDMKIKEDGDHILPLSRPEWCAKEIKDFLSERELER